MDAQQIPIAKQLFRENKILYPAIRLLQEDLEWRVIYEIGREISFLVDVKDEWTTKGVPRYHMSFVCGRSREGSSGFMMPLPGSSSRISCWTTMKIGGKVTWSKERDF